MVIDLSKQPSYFEGLNYKNIIRIGDWSDLDYNEVMLSSFYYSIYNNLTKCTMKSLVGKTTMVTTCGNRTRDVVYLSNTVGVIENGISTSRIINIAVAL